MKLALTFSFFLMLVTATRADTIYLVDNEGTNVYTALHTALAKANKIHFAPTLLVQNIQCTVFKSSQSTECTLLDATRNKTIPLLEEDAIQLYKVLTSLETHYLYKKKQKPLVRKIELEESVSIQVPSLYCTHQTTTRGHQCKMIVDEIL